MWEILGEISMIKTSTNSRHGIYLFPIGVGIAAVLSAALASAATSHGATGNGVTATCSVVNPNRFQCNFPALAANQALKIQYVSMQCGSSGTPFSLQLFQVFTTPPNSTSEVSYQIPITNQASLGGVVSAGSPVKLFAKSGSQPRALIDLVPAPVNPGTQCTVSVSGVSVVQHEAEHDVEHE
jgi:hypothetical protein